MRFALAMTAVLLVMGAVLRPMFLACCGQLGREPAVEETEAPPQPEPTPVRPGVEQSNPFATETR